MVAQRFLIEFDLTVGHYRLTHTHTHIHTYRYWEIRFAILIRLVAQLCRSWPSFNTPNGPCCACVIPLKSNKLNYFHYYYVSALCRRRCCRRHPCLIQARLAAGVHLDDGVALAPAAADVGVYLWVCLCEFVYVWVRAAFVGQLGGTFDQYLQHFKLIPAILWLRPLASVAH